MTMTKVAALTDAELDLERNALGQIESVGAISVSQADRLRALDQEFEARAATPVLTPDLFLRLAQIGEPATVCAIEHMRRLTGALQDAEIMSYEAGEAGAAWRKDRASLLRSIDPNSP